MKTKILIFILLLASIDAFGRVQNESKRISLGLDLPHFLSGYIGVNGEISVSRDFSIDLKFMKTYIDKAEDNLLISTSLNYYPFSDSTKYYQKGLNFGVRFAYLYSAVKTYYLDYPSEMRYGYYVGGDVGYKFVVKSVYLEPRISVLKGLNLSSNHLESYSLMFTAIIIGFVF